MENKHKLSNLMLVHHGLLEILFTSLEGNIKKENNLELTHKILDEFRWELEKHFFVEEKTIFNFCSITEPISCSMVVQLLNEHKAMKDMLDELSKEPNKNALLEKFKELLMKHRITEDKELYPRIDEELNEEDKDLIVSRINELPIKKLSDSDRTA